jgi:hypothetical protein
VTEGIPDETRPNDAENAKAVDELFRNAKIGATLPLVSLGLSAYATGVGYGALEAGVAIEVSTNISGGAVELLMRAIEVESSPTNYSAASQPIWIEPEFQSILRDGQ